MMGGVEVPVVGDEWSSRSRQEGGLRSGLVFYPCSSRVGREFLNYWVNIDPRERVGADH